MTCHLSVTGAVVNHLQKNHKPEWDAYAENRTKSNAKKTQAKEEEKVACEMENNEVRFYDIRSSKGRLPFLKKVGPSNIFLISMMFPVQILPDVCILLCSCRASNIHPGGGIYFTAMYAIGIYFPWMGTPLFGCCTVLKKSPYFRDLVPIGTFFTFWVPILAAEGPY